MTAIDERLSRISGRRKIILGVLTVTLATVLGLVAAEYLLEAYEDYQRDLGRLLPDYGDVSRDGPFSPGGYLLENFTARVRNGYGGTVPWTNNGQGFRHEHDFTAVPPEGTIRILSLGDSFTAGYRVGQRDTFSRRMEELSTAEEGPTEVLISLIVAPEKGLRYLEQYGIAWNPHIALMGITLGNDLAHTYVALHPQPLTFDDLRSLDIPERALRPRQENRLLDWLQERRVYRLVVEQLIMKRPRAIGTNYNDEATPKLFDGVHGLGIYLRDPPAEIELAYQRLFEVLLQSAAFCRENGIAFAALVFPQRFQVQPEDWEAAVHEYGLRADQFDLMQPNHRIREFCDRHSLECIDPTSHMQDHHLGTGENLYLPGGDMHWNPDGHRVWLEGAWPALNSLIKTARDSR